MKALVLSITAGNGHNATAKSIRDYLESQGAEARFMDTFEYLSPFLRSATENVFLFSSKYAQKPYALSYRMAEKMQHSSEALPMREYVAFLASKLKVYLDEFKPDVILSSHVFPAMIMDCLKSRFGMKFMGIGVLTDFTYHPFWESCTHLDYLVTPNELFELEGVKRGYAPKQLLPFGIPIHTKFAEPPKHSKEKIRKALGLDPDCPTVLIMSGSMGHGSMSKTVKLLDSLPNDMQMICVCGTNREEKRKIERESYQKKVVPMGWCNFVEKLMDGSDCLISKPGGITTSEAMAKRLPLIMMHPMPGQEDRNIEFLLNNGVAMNVTSTSPLDTVLYHFLSNPLRLESIKANMEVLRRPESTKTLGDFIMQS